MGFPLAIDTADPMPIYAQLERGIKTLIANGRLKEGDQLPTVRQMAVEMKINANTVAKVYTELERGGLIQTKRGVGTFILRPTQKTRRQDLTAMTKKFVADAGALGFSVRDIRAEIDKL